MISIIIPSFNKAQYISETFDSLLHQTYTNWEAVVVDDGSTDSSQEIIKEYCKKDSRIKLLERQRLPKGGSTCRNIGVEHSQGEYVVFLDADDVLISKSLENRVNQFNRFSDNDFLVFSGGTFYKTVGDSDSKWIPKQNYNHLKEFISHSISWQTSAPIWRKSFLQDLGGFDEAYPRLQDVELHTRALMAENVKYKVIAGKPDFYYRIDEERKLKSPFSFVETFIKAVKLYTTKMHLLIEPRGDKKPLLKALNGTYQSAYLTAQVQYDLGNINKEERNKLFDMVLRFHQPKGLFKIYVKGLTLGIHKIKGYNRVFKKVLSGM